MKQIPTYIMNMFCSVGAHVSQCKEDPPGHHGHGLEWGGPPNIVQPSHLRSHWHATGQKKLSPVVTFLHICEYPRWQMT